MEHQDQIRSFVEARVQSDGLTETGLPGVQLFRATQPVPCMPAVYEPCVVAIACGTKEAVLDGARYVYDNRQYLCCPMSMPVQAGTPTASPETPLYGVYISLLPRVMRELSLEMDSAGSALRSMEATPATQAIRLAKWDKDFSEALVRLLNIADDATDRAVLGDARMRELYYAILKGDAGVFARKTFGVGNAIARSISYVSSNLNEAIAIDDLASRAGMSRAVFHRKFKEATTMSPIQFVKNMRLNNAAMKISEGMTVSEAAMDVGYVSPSQFTREFRRLYGQSPRQWSDTHQLPVRMA